MNSSASRDLRLLCGALTMCGCLALQVPGAGTLFAEEAVESLAITLPYDGYLTEAGGEPLEDGQYDITFSLHTKSSGGPTVWVERHAAVTITNGFFHVELGSGKSPLDLPFDEPYYLGVRVGSDPEMTPRLKLPMAAYTIRARVADDVRNESITSEKLTPLSVTDDHIKSVHWSKITGIPKELAPADDDGVPGASDSSSTGGVPAATWKLRGNRDSSPDKNFIGTTDGQPLVVKTANQERMRVRDTGEIKILSTNDVDPGLELSDNAAVTVDGGVGIRKGLTVVGASTFNSTTTEGDAIFNGSTTLSTLLVSGSGDLSGDHLALFENTGGASSDGIAIKINDALGTDNNYVTFLNSSDETVGRIEAQTLGQYFGTPTTIAAHAYQAAMAVATGLALGWFPPSPTDIVANTATLAYAVALTDIHLLDELVNDVGITYASGSGDYAEWLLRLDPDEEMTFGDIVGVKGGKISKQTDGADQILVVSLSPIVLGNMPEEGKEDLYEKVAFLGQVLVKTRGTVHAGDYIVPSDFEDGTGIAVRPEKMTARDFTKVVGRAWSTSEVDDLKLVKVAVGLGARDVATLAEAQESQLIELRAALEQRDDQMQALQGEVAALQNAVRDLQFMQASLAVQRAAPTPVTRSATLTAPEDSE